MMCNNKNTSRLVNKTKTQANRSRKSRSRTRKPKYLSLSKHMIKTNSQPPSPPSSSAIITKMPRQLKNLFPLHPENLVDDRSSADEDVALLFHGSDAADDLTALLQSATSSDSLSLSYDRQTTTTMMYDSNDDEEDRHRSLVKSAMKRNRSERDAGEEKWVCYSEVVEEVTSSSKDVGNKISTSVVRRSKKKKKKKKHETTSSSSGNTSTTTTTNTTSNSNSNSNSNMSKSLSLALKLDYQGILNAWSDKGSLFIQGGDHDFPSSPQTVPDLKYDLGLMDGWGSNGGGNLWKVPESGGLKIKEEIEGKDNGWKVGQREASVLRYKEKRQSRLFSKRIRYEVRKLNAEKRPRMKGRFVKID